MWQSNLGLVLGFITAWYSQQPKVDSWRRIAALISFCSRSFFFFCFYDALVWSCSEIRPLQQQQSSQNSVEKSRWTELLGGSSMWKQIWSFTPAASEVWSFHSSLIFGLCFKAPDKRALTKIQTVKFRFLYLLFCCAIKFNFKLWFFFWVEHLNNKISSKTR